MKHNRILSGIIGLALLAACNSSNPVNDKPSSPVWEKQYSGVWKSTVNNPADFNLLSVSSKKPRVEAIEMLADAPIPVDQNEITAFTKNGRTYLRFPLKKEEQLYGFGLNFKTVRQRGRIMRLHVDHYGGKDDGRTHAPVPFFVSDRGYGVLINAARYIDVYAGTGVRKDSKNQAIPTDRNTNHSWSSRPYSDNLEFIIPEEGVELIMFTGKNMMEVVQRFNLYCGGGFIPPKWGLGFWQRTPTLYSDNDIRKEVEGFENKNFPLDVIGLEPGWHSKAYPCTFEWDKSRYPDPKGFAQEMAQKGINLNLWCNPYLWPDSELDKKMKPYTGSHTVWCGTVPDFTMPKAKTIMQDHLKKHQLDVGVSGFKIDEVDGFDVWVWPDNATFPSGHDGEQMRQTYGTQMMELTDQIYRERNQRSYGLIRAANAGSVSYPYVIYNDYYSHQDFITALINAGFSGLLWTPEVRASNSSEEWVRRMQTVCFSPIAMINAWADGTKPWSFPDVYPACQDVAFLRMQLLPYIYSTFAQYYFEGKPPFRAMELVDGYLVNQQEVKGQLDATANPYAEAVKKEVKDQYMMGDFILVAPLFSMEDEREVVLPQGNWYNFYTGEYVGNGEIVTVKASLDKIPLFVKDGAILPMIPKIRQASEWTNDLPIELRVYGKEDGTFQLYNDDGKTYNYEEGEYTLVDLSVKGGKGTAIKRKGNADYTMKWKFMTK
ncbi:TIM-barrel domain-containing protein [Sunxiuqinia sp. sy24]|uniref:TIM-barrel domain-containing protein n=1 Tax=Sunxiuqinia sp. sy24 TaxID=3461495 RepID=UPI004045F557